MTAPAAKNMDDIVALCRRRGFIWQSSEIYGGIQGFWDYGPLGAQLKKNLKDAWWTDTITCPPDGPDGHPLQIVPVDTTIIMHPKVWEASGHVGGFNDPMVEDKGNGRFRADHLVGIYELPIQTQNEFEHDLELLRKIVSPAQIPARTVVASTVGEAIARVLEDKAYRKGIGVRSASLSSVLDYDGSGPAADVLQLDLGQGAKNYIFKFPHPSVLTDAPERVPSPVTGKPGTLTEPRMFNLMYETHNGPIRSDENKAYLRPETAQGIFTQFWNVVDTSRVKTPFGIAQMGKSFRNEVTPRNFTFRSREFEQMEIEFFIHPSEAVQWYRYWRDMRFAWWQSVGLAGANLQLREHDKDELSHYAKEGAGVCDVEYRFPFTAPGFGELEGVAHRSDFDLRQHAKFSRGEEKMDTLRYFDQERNERYFPHVIEPSAGADRGTLAILCEAYTPTPDRSGAKAIMQFVPRMAPIKAGIFPLVAKDGMPEIAEKLYKEVRKKHVCQLDVKQNIGKRYARMDEAGTPFCFTIDGDSLNDQTVTVRDRDTLAQDRVALDKVVAYLDEKIGS